MKYVLLQVGVLTGAVVLAVAIGRGPVAGVWGPAGVTSLHAAAVICLIAAVAAAIPLGLTATYWHPYTPHVAFAGTAVRLLGTGLLGLAYYMLADPDPLSFLACIGALYLVLLLAETGLIMYIVLRVYGRRLPTGE